MKAILKIALAAYLISVAAAEVYRAGHPPDFPPRPGERAVVINAVSGDRESAQAVRVALYDSIPHGLDSPPVVVLLHGSPGDNGEVTRIARLLADQYRVIAPDLPGFGGSTRRIPDYSIRAHAQYVAELLDSLRIRRVHVVGFSMGGGVALNLADIAPGKVASLTMLSAIGAQEYELLGDYYLNHAIHGIQLGGLWLIDHAIPRFSPGGDAMLTHEYARNFYDTDQRPLRGILERWPGPMLIIQGKRDPLVPPAIGPEHARIVPQSELVMPDGDHFMAFERSPELAGYIRDFVARVEAGTAITRATATPERVAAAARPFDPRSAPAANGIGFVVLLLLIAAATLVTEDLTCIATGLLVVRGTVGFIPGTLACLVGIVGGDLLLYAAGRYLGRPALRRRPLRWILTDDDLTRTSEWFSRRGPALVLTTRFVPGTRLPTYVAAGVLHTRFLPFLGYFVLAAALWTPLLVGVAMLYGDTVLTAFSAYRHWSFPLLFIAGLALLIVVKVAIPLLSWKGRRLMLSRWRRLTRWEFWPMWAFYPPIALYVLWLGVRYRGVTVFTAANPAIPGGGLAGESKWQILQGIAQGNSGEFLPATTLLPAMEPLETRRARILEFMAANRLNLPIVLKPDVGERGAGVAIVHSAAALEGYLSEATGDVLAQEYLPGLEFGVFYYRLPGEDRGRIFSITEKRLPAVIGDGHSTLEILILADDRAVCMARFLLGRHSARLWEVPGEGGVVPLVELGTHSRGAAFFDGTGLATGELEDAVDRVSRGYPGFYFGRYDVRAESVEALQCGRFRIVELNGVSSEATSIYDPRHRLGVAYRTLRAQWRLAFEIGARNRAAGHPPATLAELRALLRRHRVAKRGHATH